jgi:hypothetical protein
VVSGNYDKIDATAWPYGMSSWEQQLEQYLYQESTRLVLIILQFKEGVIKMRKLHSCIDDFPLNFTMGSFKYCEQGDILNQNFCQSHA